MIKQIIILYTEIIMTRQEIEEKVRTFLIEELEIEVLREKYADQHAIGVVAWMEFDAKVEDAQKISKLVCATTPTPGNNGNSGNEENPDELTPGEE